MRKTIVCLALVGFVTGLAGGPAYGQSCENFNVILKEAATDLDPTEQDLWRLAIHFGIRPPFDYCWSQRVIGTVQGVWALCGNDDLSMFDPLGLGVGPELWGNPGIIYTKQGDMIITMSYGLSVWDFDGDFEDIDAFGGLTTFDGGNGAYTGASGWTTDSPKKYPASFWIQSHGFLCVPD